MSSDQSDEQLNRPETPEEDGPREAIGAYLLDALTDDERAEIDAYLAESAEGRQEVRELAPVVSLLPLLLEAELANDPSLARIQPSADLRTRLLDAVRAEQPAPAVEPPAEAAPPPAPEPIPIATARAHGRIRGGAASTASSSPWETISRMGPAWLAAAVLGIVAVGAVIWVLALQGTIDDKDREIKALQEQTKANAWQLAPSDDGQAAGTLLYSLQDKTGALVVRNLPALPSDKVYQLWYIRGNNSPEPGGTFAVDDQGTGVAQVNSDVPTYDAVALTEEPAGGSTEPTMPILLSGQVSETVGSIPGSGVAAILLAPPEDAAR
jgi:anti-sigma-K factor RskA